jgi:hypothetical protein
MDRLHYMFDLGASQRESKQGGRDTPPTLPAARQRRFQDYYGEDDYTITSSQARLLGGEPTTGSMISFALGEAAALTPQPVT